MTFAGMAVARQMNRLRTAALAAGATLLTIVAVLLLGAKPAAAADAPIPHTYAGSTTIPSTGAASPYPTMVTVSGLGRVEKVRVVLVGATHTYPADLDVAIQAPTGQTVMLMSDAGGDVDINGFTLTFDDTGVPVPTPITPANTFRPTNASTDDVLPNPAPAGPYPTTLATFNGLNPNGQWRLFVYDDSAGDAGSISSWRLELTAPIEVTNATGGGAAGSLGAALIRASGIAGAQTISFNIPGAGPHVITPVASGYPVVTSPVTIDGFSQPGATRNTSATASNSVLKIQISGAGSDEAQALNFLNGAAGSVVRGISFTGWSSRDAVLAQVPVSIVGCFVGPNADGTAPSVANDYGIRALLGAGVTIGGTTPADRNVISGNRVGVVLRDPNGATVRGNLVGTKPSGVAAMANEYGIIVDGDVTSATIGGTTTTARNVISGNTTGLVLQATTGAATVHGNYVGLGSDGSTVVGNGNGISTASASGPVIGGSVAGSGNVISGNANGVDISAYSAKLVGNRIGTNAAGTAARGNGVGVRGRPTLGGVVSIGDGTPGGRNVISGNTQQGIAVAASSQHLVTLIVEGNYVGTNAAGSAAIPNAFGGIVAEGDFVSARIGNNSAGKGNVISGNGYAGIALLNVGQQGEEMRVRGNHIGLSATGLPLGNIGAGIRLESARGILIGGTTAADRNVVSGNSGAGLSIVAGPGFGGVQVYGNHIGTNPAGTAAVGNGVGIEVRDGATGVLIGGNDDADGTVDGVSRAGNVVSGNDGEGILVTGATPLRIEGNRIGTNAAGTGAVPNLIGVRVTGGAKDVPIGNTTLGSGNVISGNIDAGVVVEGVGTDRTWLRGNLIGLRAAGDVAVPNGTDGVQLLDGARATRVGGRGIGDRNFISGNGLAGIHIANQGTTAIVENNLIGTNAVGNAAVGNGADGVTIVSASGNVIGGTSLPLRNVISGNAMNGVSILGVGANSNRVYGNLIGLGLNTGTPIGNGLHGVEISEGAQTNLLGAGTAGARNAIAANGGHGVLVEGAGTTGTRILGNYIGTSGDGLSAVANRGSGISIGAGARLTVVGTLTAGNGNKIRNNGGAGVEVLPGAARSSIRGNELAGNVRIGIDLVAPGDTGAGSTANDNLDADTGANGLQNRPQVGSASVSNGSTTVTGAFAGARSTTVTIDVYRGPSAATPAAVGYVGTVTATTDAAGNATWSLTMPVDLAGQLVTATATSPSGDTSELAPAALVSPPA